MKNYMLKTFVGASLCITGASLASAQVADTETASEQSRELDVVVVTAQKREGDLQKVPIAVTAFGADDVRDRRILAAADIVSLTPGATFVSSNPLEQLFSIRGISSGQEGASADAGVLMMVDGEVISRDFMRTANLFDVARIEVLRGPQGTLYGRNSTGGVFHVLTNKPSSTFESNIRFDAGSYNLVEAEGFVSGPLSDRVSGRVSGFFQSRDGYTEDIVQNTDLDSVESLALRGQLLFEPNQNTSILLRTNYSDEDLGPIPRKLFDPSLPYTTPAVPFFSYTEASSDPYLVATTPSDGYEREILGGSVDFEWQNEEIIISSLTAIRDASAVFDQDTFTGTEAAVTASGRENAVTISHETRVSNAPSSDDLIWTAGVFYLNEDTERDETRLVFPDIAGGAIRTEQFFNETNTTNSLGLFGNTEFLLSEKTALDVGLRYSRDEKDYTIEHGASGPFAAAFLQPPLSLISASPSAAFEATTWKIAVRHQLSETANIYASAGNGFKAGGFNPEPSTAADATIPFDEETVMSYEVGAKAELFDRKLRLNGAAFFSQFEDIQEEFATETGSIIIANVGEAEILGVEIEAVYTPNSFVTWTLAAASFEHEYTEFVDADGNDNSGNPIANVPDWTLSTSFDADIPIPDTLGFLSARLDYRTRADISDVPSFEPVFNIREGKSILDARVTWKPKSERYSVSVWGKNLFDQAEINQIPPQAFFSQTTVIYGPPLTAGISFDMPFGH